MELSTERIAATLVKGQQLSHKSKIVVLLTKLAIRKQAKLDTQDYLVFAEDLAGFELQDITQGLDQLGLTPRERGQTSFPEAAEVIGAVRKICIKRRRWEKQRADALEWEDHKARCIEERRQADLTKSQDKKEAN